MDKAREVKKQWKLRLLKRIKDEKNSIELQSAALKEIEWNLETFEKQMSAKYNSLVFERIKIQRDLDNFKEDERLTKLDLTNRRNIIQSQLQVKKNNLKVLENQLKKGVTDETLKTKKQEKKKTNL